MGNKMETDVVCFVLALMSNRTVIVESNFPTTNEEDRIKNGVKYEHIYEYPSFVVTNRNQLSDDTKDLLQKYEASYSFPRTVVPTDLSWCCYDVNSKIVNSSSQFVTLNDLLYSSMIHVNKWTDEYARAHFGLHSVYFISNFFSRFPDFVANETKNTLDDFFGKRKIDRRNILGVHIRFHRAGQYYSHGLNMTLPTFYEEIDRRIEQNNDLHIALATDSEDVKNTFTCKYGSDRVITSSGIVVRKADRDHVGAMLDMQLLSSCSEIIATYRSTFSFIVVARTGRNAWYVDKESPHSFPGSSSQCCCISMIYHQRDHCDWRTMR